MLYAPPGSGKSTLLAEIHEQISATASPGAFWSVTSSLDDITRAFSEAYPNIPDTDLALQQRRLDFSLTENRLERRVLLAAVPVPLFERLPA